MAPIDRLAQQLRETNEHLELVKLRREIAQLRAEVDLQDTIITQLHEHLGFYADGVDAGEDGVSVRVRPDTWIGRIVRNIWNEED